MHKLVNSIKSLILVACVALFASCSTQKIAYESLIPVTEEGAVFSTNIAQFKNKIGAETESTITSFLKLAAANSDDYKYVDKAFKSPESLGLNTSKNLYYVIHPMGEKEFAHAIYMSLTDYNKFDQFLEQDIKLPKDERKEVGGYTYYKLDNDVHLFYNKNLVILSSSYQHPMYMSSTKTVLSDAIYFDVVKEMNDLSFGFNYAGLSELLNRIGKSSLNSFMSNRTFTPYTAISLNFENGKIVFNQNNYAGSGEAKENFEKAVNFVKPISGIFSKKITKDPYFYVLCGLKGKGLVDFAESIFMEHHPINNNREVLDLAKAFVDNIDGDVLFAVSDFSVGFSNASVDASLFIEGDAAKMYDVVSNKIPTSLVASSKENQMEVLVDKIKLYIGVYEGFFYVTTTESVAKNPAKNLESNLTASRYYIKNSGATQMVLDVKSILKNPLVKLVMAQQKSSQKDDVATQEMIKYVEGMDYISSTGVVASDKSESTLKVVLDDKSNNSLSVLVDLIVRIALGIK